jgi:type IV secretion system protein VirB5
MDKNKPLEPQNQYQRAFDEWDTRIGSAQVQARNWRLACLGSILLAVLLIIGIFMLLLGQKNYVYVAEVSPSSGVVNLQSVDTDVQPSSAEEAYFIGRFIHNVMSLPLDPVVARKNWLAAYDMVAGQAVNALTQYAQQNPPFGQLGNQTRSVSVKNFNPIGNHSYEFTWVVTTYDNNGAVQTIKLYNGVFTVTYLGAPKTIDEIMVNPLGIKIAYFNFKSEG